MNSKQIKVILTVCLLAVFTLCGCGESKELLELQGRYDELQKNNTELNEKYLQLYSDYENLKAEKEDAGSGAKYYEVAPGSHDVTIMAPNGETITYTNEMEKFKVLEQMQMEFDKRSTKSGDDALTISIEELDKNEELTNQYWMLSGWGTYSP